MCLFTNFIKKHRGQCADNGTLGSVSGSNQTEDAVAEEDQDIDAITVAEKDRQRTLGNGDRLSRQLS